MCNDGNVCTDDSCNPATGCVYTNNTASCDDGNACTTADTCSGGACVGGTPLVCNDSNACTDDSCNPSSGCVYTPNTLCVDYDVLGFRCSHSTSVGGTTTITVVIKNQGTTNPGALLTLSGMQGVTLIPIVTGVTVSDPVGGGRTTYTFSYIPVTTGNILWSVLLTDGDPDFDGGMCTTIVK